MAKKYTLSVPSINQIIVQGSVGSDAEFNSEVGSGLLKFSIATNKSWKDNNDEWQEKVTWHNINVWGKAAESLRGKINKGDIVRVAGEMESNKRDDKVFWAISPSLGGVKVVARAAEEDDLPY